MLVMLNTLMDISEAESGAMPLQREPVALADVVGARRRSVSRRRGREGRHARRPTRGRRRRRRARDRTRLEQVAANLIDNAVKYTPAGGRVDVEVGARRRAARVLRVRDTGIGIPADELPRIWDRLFRGDTQPDRARPWPRPEPRQGDRRGARRDGRGRAASPAAGRRLRCRCPLSPSPDHAPNPRAKPRPDHPDPFTVVMLL